MIIAVLSIIAGVFLVVSGWLIRHGQRGQRGLVWTMRMDDDRQ